MAALVIAAKMFGFGTPAPRANVTVEHESWCERMGHALCGVIFGIFLFLGGIFLVGWGEGRNVHTQCAIFEASKIVKTATCDYSSSLDGELVYASCDINQNVSEVDFSFPDLNFKGHGVKYQSTLAQYQTIETKKCTSSKDKAGGGKTTTCTYSYAPGWSSSHETFANPNPVPPQRANPTYPTLKGKGGQAPDSQKAPKMEMGKGYLLTGAMIDDATSKSAVTTLWNQTTNYKDSNKWSSPGGSSPEALKNGANSNFRYDKGSAFYVTYPLGTIARLGDLRIQITTYGSVKDFSIVGKQNKDGSFEQYTFKKCDNYGALYFQAGKATVADMFSDAKDTNKVITYVLRFGGFLIIWFGLHLCSAPIALMPDLIPCIGPFIGDLVGCLLCCFTCLIATSVFLITFAISWVYFRPLVGIPMFVVAVLILGGVIFWRVKSKRERDAANDSSLHVMDGYAPPNTDGQF